MTTVLIASSFANRDELEKTVAGSTGLTPDIKEGVSIVGTRKELEALHLTDRTMFWGIKCEITDDPTKVPTQVEKPARGEVFEHGVNLSDDKKGKKKHAKSSK